jgi:hypothetical protein
MTPSELKAYFQLINLPETILLTQGVKIINIQIFLSTAFSTIEKNPNNLEQNPAWLRLLKLYQLLRSTNQ